jgi:hypothetical protein
MRADAAHRLRHALFMGVVAILAATPAAGEGVYGTVQMQYQKLEDNALLLGANNTLRTLSTNQETWLRSVDLRHQDWLRPNLMLESNLRYADREVLNGGDLSRTPAGSLRLIGPWLQLAASHQPATTRSSLSAQSGVNGTPENLRLVTSRNQESYVTGHLAVPRWPLLDLSWIRRRRDGAGAVADQNISRNGRLTYDRDRYSAYAGVSDQIVSSRMAGAKRNTQQVFNSGGTWRYAPLKSMAFNSQYDFSAVRGQAAEIQQPTNLTQSATLSGDWRPAPRWVGSANYQWRRIDSGTPYVPTLSDQEGSLLGRYLFARRSSAVSGFGFRTFRGSAPGGTATVGLQRYATALVSVDTPVRRNWNMSGSISHNTNWDPGRGPSSTEALTATSRAALTRRIQLDGSYLLTANGDTASLGSRYSVGWTAHLQCTPLRTIQLSSSMRNMRTGPGIFRPVSVLRGFSADVNWRPAPRLQVLGQYGTNVSLPAGGSGTSTRSASFRYDPRPQWQWYGSWTRSEQTVFVSSAGRLSSRETVSGRLQYAPSRRLATSAEISYNEPGKPLESRRIDVVTTWSFGR